MICKTCGTLQHGESALPGSGWIELVLWLCYLIPGVIYSIWRRSSRTGACVSCGSRDLVAEGSPVGQKLLNEHYPNGRPTLPPVVLPKQGFVHRLTAVLLWLIGAVFAITFLAAVVAALSR